MVARVGNGERLFGASGQAHEMVVKSRRIRGSADFEHHIVVAVRRG
jgi:hypothetical protein